MRRPDQKNFGVNINEEIADTFSEQVESRGQKKFRALEGALRLWVNLPNEIQAILISCPDFDVRQTQTITSNWAA